MSVVLSDHLPLLASAPDGIQKLRGLVLELAMRGKLVPQDSSDEPASELLKRIAKERARLEAAGQCKKSKALPPVSEDEKPFALPHTWAWTRLGEITNFGQTDKDGEISDTTWVLDLEDIQKDTSVLLQKVRFSERQAKSDKNRFLEGDVLYGKLRPYLNKVIVADEEGVCTTEILPVRGYLGIFPRYLMYAVKRPDFLAYVNAKSYGMKMPRLGTDDGRLALFPLAPEKEQHRIVAKVDELMALCDRLEAEQADAASAHVRLVETLLGTLTQSTDATDLATNWQRSAEHFDTLVTTEASIDVLKQTVLQLAVMGKLVPQVAEDEPASELLKQIAKERAKLEAAGICKKSKPMSLVSKDAQPFAVPDGWTWVQFDEIINPEKPISYGVLVPGPEVSDGVPFARIADLSITNPPTLPEKTIDQSVDAQYSRTRLDGGEILMGVVGSIGKLGIAPLSWKGANIARAICRIVPTHHVDKPFVLLLLQSKFMQSSFVGDTRTLAQPTLNVGLIRSALTPIPPLAEQQRIVATVDGLMALCDSLKADLCTARLHQTTLADTLIESALEAA